MLEHAPIPDAILPILRDNHRLVQGAIAQKAHELMGLPIPEHPAGIYKFEGGVSINGRGLCIKERCVFDDSVRPLSREPSQEERAVVKAIAFIIHEVSQKGIGSLSRYIPAQFGDPLRGMLFSDD